MTTFGERWAENEAAYGDDIVLFAEEQWIVRATGKLIVLEPHQRDNLHLFFTRGEVTPGSGLSSEDAPTGDWHARLWNDLTDAGRARMLATSPGTFPWQTIIWSEPKKSGKTEIGGIVGLWVTMSEPGVNEGFFIANDQEQSKSRGFSTIAGQVNTKARVHNPVLADRITERKSPPTLEFRNGDIIKAIPTDYAGEAGANPTISVWDELWAYVRENLRRLWDEFTPVPTRINSIQFVTTYAGFTDESELLYDLYKRTVLQGVRIHKTLEIYESRDGDTVTFWSHTPRMPWQTPAYYARQQARMRPSAYARIHGNEWQKSASAFVDSARWDAMPQTAVKPPVSKAFPVYAGADASHKRDACAGVAVGYRPDGPFVVRHAIWTPTKEEPVIPEDTLGPWLEDLCRDFDVRLVSFDPNHMETMALRLIAKGLPLREYTQTVDNLTRAGNALYSVVAARQLLRYPAPDLDDHIHAAAAKDTPRGWKLDKLSANRPMDAATALSFAVADALEFGPVAVSAALTFFVLGGEDAVS